MIESLRKPDKVTVIAVMSLVSGIFSVIGALSWLIAGLSVFLIGVVFTAIPAAYLLIVGIFNIIYGAKLLGAGSVRPSSALAILDIVSVIFCNFIPFILGIVNLVFYQDEEVRGYFGTSS